MILDEFLRFASCFLVVVAAAVVVVFGLMFCFFL